MLRGIVPGLLACAVCSIRLAAASAPAMDPVALQQLYEARCATCHGDDAAGGLPGVPDLTEAPQVWAQSDDTLLARTIAGVNSSAAPIPMPPRGGHPDLTDDQLRNLIVYMRALATGQTP